MIPKIIHYCWFGGNPLPEDAKRCIDSWKKFFPDYEIKEWNEHNFDINCCAYVKEAYAEKKWAFVSDYARFWILYHEGGVYFDTDVEVIRDMSALIKRGSFMGCEVSNECNPGLGLAAAPGLDLYQELLEHYETIHFSHNGNMTETVVGHTTKLLKRHGWKGNGTIEEVSGVYIYPPEYFCPMDYKTGKLNITENTYSIHWYTASWQSSYGRFKTKMQHILGPTITGKIQKIKKSLKKGSK